MKTPHCISKGRKLLRGVNEADSGMFLCLAVNLSTSNHSPLIMALFLRLPLTSCIPHIGYQNSVCSWSPLLSLVMYLYLLVYGTADIGPSVCNDRFGCSFSWSLWALLVSVLLVLRQSAAALEEIPNHTKAQMDTHILPVRSYVKNTFSHVRFLFDN